MGCWGRDSSANHDASQFRSKAARITPAPPGQSRYLPFEISGQPLEVVHRIGVGRYRNRRGPTEIHRWSVQCIIDNRIVGRGIAGVGNDVPSGRDETDRVPEGVRAHQRARDRIGAGSAE